MFSFFFPIALSLLAGYVAAFFVYAALLLAISRLGARVLMRGSRPSPAYAALHALAWALAALTGAYLCGRFAPAQVYGAIIFPGMVGSLLAGVVVRSFLRLKGQMSLPALGAVLLGIASGTVSALYLHGALAAVNA